MITDADSFRIVRRLPHTNVGAALGTAQRIGLDTLLVSRPCRERQLVMAISSEAGNGSDKQTRREVTRATVAE